MCFTWNVHKKQEASKGPHGGIGNFNSRGIECRWYKRIKKNNGTGRVKLGEGVEGQSRGAQMGKSN